VRIAVCTNTYRPSVNGVVNSIEAFRVGLEAAGHEVLVCAPKARGHVDEGDNVFRFPAWPFARNPDYPVPFPASKAVTDDLAPREVDIVHTQHPWLLGKWGQVFARRQKLPLVTTIHTQYEQYSHYAWPVPGDMVGGPLRRSVRRYSKKVHIVITPGQAMRAYHKDLQVRAPVEVVPNATDLSGFDTADGTAVRRTHGIPPGDALFMFVGRAAPEKGLDRLINAYVRVARDLPDSRLMIVGGGPQLDEFRRFAASQPTGGRIVLTGPVPYEQIREYHAAADVFATASVTEVQPLSLSEAMAAQTPIAGPDAGGINDMVEHGVTGLLAPPASGAEGLARVMLELGADADLRGRLGEAAQKASRQYDIPNATGRLIRVYEQAIEMHKAGRATQRRGPR